MAEERIVLTRGGYAYLQEELQRLEAQLGERREQLDDTDEDTGNLEGEEAGAFFEAKTSLEHLEQRIGNIRYILERADVRSEDPNPRRIDPGERIIVWDDVEQRERTFDLVSGEEVRFSYTRDDGGRDVAADSPVGQAFIGKTIGDVVEVEVPDGVARYTIRRILRMPGEV